MYEERDYWTVRAMHKIGGSFVSQLGTLALHADPINLQKIKDAFRLYWDNYEQLGIELEKNHNKK